MDHPNERSSHVQAVPRSGGIAIVATSMFSLCLIPRFSELTLVTQPFFLSFLGCALSIAAISFYDDIAGKHYFFKLALHILAVVFLLAMGFHIETIFVPMIGHIPLANTGYILSFLWIVGLTNAYNFMDGLDGLAAGVAVITGIAFSLIIYQQGSAFTYVLSYGLAAGALGFLIFNFPPAKIFMGDVGSAFVGFVFASIAIMAHQFDVSQTSILVMPLLLFNFIFDTVFTFFRRLIRRENVFAAHRSHLYQLLHQLGYSAPVISGMHYGMCIVQAVCAWWMVRDTQAPDLTAFLPSILIQAGYAAWVMHHAKRASLL